MTIRSRQNLLVLLFLCTLLHSPFAKSENTMALVDAGIDHYDRGSFDEAIALFEEVLDLEPKNGTAAYELAISHLAKSDYQSCVKISKKYRRKLRKDTEQAFIIPLLASTQASCHSAAGNSKAALKVFRATLDDHPDDYSLNFNIAITLVNEGMLDEAILHLEKAVQVDPSHPSPYYVLGGCYQELDQAVKALLAYATFLQIEFNSTRSVTAAQSAITTALSTVDLSGDEGVNNIFISPSATSARDSGDIMMLTLALGVSAAAKLETNESDGLSAEPIAELLQSFFSILADVEIKDEPKLFYKNYLVPPVVKLEEGEVSIPFSYYVLETAGVSGAGEWIDEHSQEIDALVEYFESRGAKTEPLPE